MKVVLPVTWEMCGYVVVEADDIPAATSLFDRTSNEIPLPPGAEYVDASFHLTSEDPEEIELHQALLGKV